MRTLLVLILFCCASNGARAGDWPQFLGPTRNGVSPETGLLDQWGTNGPPLVWEKQIGTGYSAPSVRNGQLVVFHRVGNEEVIESLRADNGQPFWRYAYGSEFIDPY